jgi:hypothetical protein
MYPCKPSSITIRTRQLIGALTLLVSASLSAQPSQQGADAEARLQQLSQQLALRTEQIEPARQILRQASAARQAMIESDRAQRQQHRAEIEAPARVVTRLRCRA